MSSSASRLYEYEVDKENTTVSKKLEGLTSIDMQVLADKISSYVLQHIALATGSPRTRVRS